MGLDITTNSETRVPKRIAELDGMRGIAILLVLISHMQAMIFYGLDTSLVYILIDRLISSGWVGVDVFFVLSGYLITSILLKREPREYFWKVFYLRRAARILPAFFVVLSITLYLYHPVPLSIIVMYLLFIGNWTILLHHEVPPLNHIWSLAIEEQFYLIWPVIVRRISNFALLYVALSIASFSLALRIVLSILAVNPYIIYKITPARLDGLTLGAALAVAMTLDAPHAFLTRNYRKLFFVGFTIWIIGFCALKLSYFPWDARSLLLAAPAVAIMTSIGIFASVESYLPTYMRTLLTNGSLTWLGQRSYGLYLIHEPVRAAATGYINRFYTHHQPTLLSNLAITSAVLFICLILTELSWLSIETPFMKIGAKMAENIKRKSRVPAN